MAAARELAADGTGFALRSYDGFLKASARRARILADEEKVARAEYAEGMKRLIEASRKARLLMNLHDSDLRTWQYDFDRELAEFAAEALLMRQSALRRSATRPPGGSFHAGIVEGTIRKRTGA